MLHWDLRPQTEHEGYESAIENPYWSNNILKKNMYDSELI